MSITVNGKTFDWRRTEDDWENDLDVQGLISEEDLGDDKGDEGDGEDPLLQLKALVRRVRSAAGARRFGQPIGSIIREDEQSPIELSRAAAERATRGEGRGPSREELGRRRKKAQVRKKVEGNFHDTYALRGWDFINEDDEDYMLFDGSDEDQVARQKMIVKEADELGVKVLSHGRYEEPPLDYLESALASFRAYYEWYPGMEYYMNTLLFDDMGKNTNASNSVRPQYDSETQTIYEGTLLSFNLRHFGNSDSSARNTETNLRNADARQWYSVRGQYTADKTGMELWRTAFLKTFNHEAGHTMARMGFGHLIGGVESDEDRKTRRDWFVGELSGIFEKYGLRFQEGDPDEVVGTSHFTVPRHKTDPWLGTITPKLIGMDPEEVQEVLSEYGKTNIHEMMAESWAEYTFDPEPRAFARDIGELLDQAANDFLDANGAR